MSLNNLWTRSGGTWKQVERPYVKRGKNWAPVKKAWIKKDGVWEMSFEWDVAPPPSPLMSLDLISSSQGRHLRLGVRLPGTAHDNSLKLIRLLKSNTKGFPTSPNGATYYSTPDTTYPFEAWGDFWYNGNLYGRYGKYHSNSSTWYFKEFPINVSSSYDLPAGEYRFAAWAQDIYGNWSGASNISLYVDSRSPGRIMVKSGRFPAYTTGTFSTVGSETTWIPGQLEVDDSPRKHGYYFYGETITEGMKQGTYPVTVKSAQILVRRASNDPNGAATTAVYLGYNKTLGSPSSKPGLSEVFFAGTLAKGQQKWFSLPASWYADIKDIKSIGAFHKHPQKASTNPEDRSVIQGIDVDAGYVVAGEMYVTWEVNL